MKKGIIYGLLGLVTFSVLGFAIFVFTIDSIVKSSIQDIGSEITGTSVTVSGVTISPFSGKGTVSGFRVANPEGYSREFAMEVDEFSIELDLMTLFTDEVVVKELLIQSPLISVEQKLPDNNIKDILDHIRGMESFETSDSEMVIDHFMLRNGRAALYTEVGGERSAEVEISEFELNDLGRGGGQQAVEDIIREIAEEVGERALQAAIQSGGEQIRDAIRDFFN